MLSDKEESELKISVVPTLATEITAAYTSACILTGAAPKDEQKKLAGNFTACHIAARSSLETVQAHPTAAALCREEVRSIPFGETIGGHQHVWSFFKPWRIS